MVQSALARASQIPSCSRNMLRTARQSVFQLSEHNYYSQVQLQQHNRILHDEVRLFSSSNSNTQTNGKRKYVPRKAAVEMTDQARTFFKKILENNPDKAGIMLNYQQASSGQPRMVFSFDFVSKDGLSATDEGVSLEANEDGTPKSPTETLKDGNQKLYINGNAFLKVLGATVDVDLDKITPVLYDREGNRMDPNV